MMSARISLRHQPLRCFSRALIMLAFAFLPAEGAGAQTYESSAGKLKTTVLAKGLVHPWGLAFLPDGRMLVTERVGTLRIVAPSGIVSQPLSGVPAVYADAQGGLLDVALDPNYKTNNLIYLTFAELAAEGKATTAVAQARLSGLTLQDVKVIFRLYPPLQGNKHFGSRLAFAQDGTLFVTLGDRVHYSEWAQHPATHLGKVVHITTTGEPAPDNPRAEGRLPEIWSSGHRNMQGAAIEPQTGVLWTVEHGPRGGDEVNIERAGKNYGWPDASYGSHYSYWPIPDDHTGRGFEEPVHYWTPSISPSGMAFYTGTRFPSWQGDLFVGALSGKCLIRLDLENGKVLREERLLKEMDERFRDVRQGPDGLLYLLTDSNEGTLLRLEPAQ